MFRFLFKKKEHPLRSIRAVHLPEYIDKTAKEIMKDVESHLAQARRKIAASKEHIKADLQVLEYAGLHNDKIPERAKAIMQGNREHYCRRVRQALEELHIPSDVSTLRETLGKLSLQLETLAKDIQKNVLVLREFFAHETSAVNHELGVLEHQIAELHAALDSSSYKVIEQIRLEWEIYQQNSKTCAAIKNQIHLLESDDLELARRQQKIEERIAAIKTSVDFDLGKAHSDNMAALREARRTSFREYEDAMSTLQLALKKYAYGGVHDALVQHYLENPLDALSADGQFAIKEIISHISREIIEGVIPLKDKKKEKSLQAIVYLNEHIHAVYATLKERESAIQELQKKLNQNIAFLNLAEQEKFLAIVKQERESIAARIKEHHHELSLNDPALALRSLEHLLSSVSKVTITIV